MRQFDVILVHHSVLQGGIEALVAEQMLHLLDRHTFVNSHGGQCTAELVRVYLRDVELTTEIAQTNLDTADLQAFTWSEEGHEESFVIVSTLSKVSGKVNLGARIKIHLSLFVSLTCYDALSILEVDILSVELDKFSYTHTC